jgi:hypothetical protein
MSTNRRSDADELFTEFFHSQLPKTWPAAPVEVVGTPLSLASTAGRANRSHLTLAFSVAALLGLALYLSSLEQPSTPQARDKTSDLLKKSEAKGKFFPQPQPLP